MGFINQQHSRKLKNEKKDMDWGLQIEFATEG
jgi:hypothetical protein